MENSLETSNQSDDWWYQVVSKVDGDDCLVLKTPTGFTMEFYKKKLSLDIVRDILAGGDVVLTDGTRLSVLWDKVDGSVVCIDTDTWTNPHHKFGEFVCSARSLCYMVVKYIGLIQ